MSRRNERERRPALEPLEGRLAPSALTLGGGAPKAAQYDDHGGHHDNGTWEPSPIIINSAKAAQYDDHGGGHHDNGTWEPKPIIIGL